MRKYFKRYSGVIIGAGLIMIIIAVALFRGGGSERGSTIRIGVVSAQTGVGSTTGIEEYRGALLAAEEVNQRGGIDGREIEIIVGDVSIDKIKDAGAVARKLIDIDKVVAIVGPQWDGPSEVFAAIADTARVPTLGPDATPDIESEVDHPYFFSTWYDNEVGIRELLRFAEKNGWKKLAVLRIISESFYEYTGDLMTKNAPAYGIEIIHDSARSDVFAMDFRTDLVRIKQKDPDALFVVLADFNLCPFVRQAHELSFDIPLLGTEASGNYASLADCPDLMEDLYFATPVPNQEYRKRFFDRFDAYPEYPSSVNAYDAMHVLAASLEKTNGQGGEALRKELAAIRYTESLSLPEITFLENGFVATPEDAFEMQVVRNEEFTSAFIVR